MSDFTLVSIGFILLAGSVLVVHEYWEQILKGIDWVRKNKKKS